MAVSSSIGSNLFGVTVGLPLPWLLYTLIFERDMEVKTIKMRITMKIAVGRNKYLMGPYNMISNFTTLSKV